ncbi:unnamed protein product [Cuscuta epithymum]|uniref:Replication protein A 70 kDa DNA-binding subunit B/D first OB fold domain-containing protein n=1 Tax=Cuscuta epithymum TaxID=186058 RepID=A0AAV0EH08_9ASTE|nr:unnamed protein product [Cuscuta epithymum]
MWRVIEKSTNQPGSIEMVIIDEQGMKIHVTIKQNLAPKFEKLLQEDFAYTFENLCVGINDTKYRRTTTHKYKLNFMFSTKCTNAPSTTIPEHGFDFMRFADISNGKDDGIYIDIIGHVVGKNPIKETLDKDGIMKKLIDFELQDLENNRIPCTVWEDLAIRMYHCLYIEEPSGPVVIILQGCQMKTWGGVEVD